MKYTKQLLTFGLLCILYFGAYSQSLEVIYDSDILSRTQLRTDQVTRFSINSNEDRTFKAFARIEISDVAGDVLGVLVSDEFLIKLGLNYSDQLISERGYKPSFTKREYENIHKPYFQFTPGSYSVCIQILSSESVELTRQCGMINIENIYDLMLVYPYNDDELIEKYPHFTWTPLVFSGKIRYKIRWIVSDRNNLSSSDFNSFPTFHEGWSFPMNIFPYKSSMPIFDKSEIYQWRVEAFLGDRKITESEIWRFRFSEPQDDVANINFIDVEEIMNGTTIYTRGDHLGLFIKDFTGHENFEYTIENDKGKDVSASRSNEPCHIVHGSNYVKIELPQSIRSNSPYTLRYKTSKGKFDKIKFVKLN